MQELMADDEYSEKFFGAAWKTSTSRNWYNYQTDIQNMLRDAEEQSHIDELTVLSKQVQSVLLAAVVSSAGASVVFREW